MFESSDNPFAHLVLLSMLLKAFGSFLRISLMGNTEPILVVDYIGMDHIVMFMAAVGEETIFRILPHLLGIHPFYRFLISCPLFALLHFLPLFTHWATEQPLYSKMTRERFCQVYDAAVSGVVLMAMQQLIMNPVRWYISCIIWHCVSNAFALVQMRVKYRYVPTTDGFVMRH